MNPMVILVAMVVLWATAAIFWLMDSPRPRETVAMLLDSPDEDALLV